MSPRSLPRLTFSRTDFAFCSRVALGAAGHRGRRARWYAHHRGCRSSQLAQATTEEVSGDGLQSGEPGKARAGSGIGMELAVAGGWPGLSRHTDGKGEQMKILTTLVPDLRY